MSAIVIVLPGLLMGALGLVFAIVLAAANRKYAVETDPRVAQIEGVLPGINCASCGFPSCELYAEAVAAETADVNLCAVGGRKITEELARIMNVAVAKDLPEPLVAVVFCQGDSDASVFLGVYRGIPDCGAAIHSQDVAKRCKFGCIGLGSCVVSCPFDAIHLNEGEIPQVDVDKCTACGRCVTACPRDLIELHPISHRVHVFCKSQDSGAIARQVCSKACIACRICEQAAIKDNNEGAVTMDRNLAVVTGEPYLAKAEYGAKCPTGAFAVGANREGGAIAVGKSKADGEASI